MIADVLPDERWHTLLADRATRPELVTERLHSRSRRPLLADGRLLLVAADHPARGMLGVGARPTVMADRRSLLTRLLTALARPGVDGVLASPDIIDELALLGALDDVVVIGTMNRGGLQGAVWELDDRMTAYTPAAVVQSGLEGGKMLLRIDDDDPGTAPTIEACARAVADLSDAAVMAMIEPLPYHRDASGQATYLADTAKLTRAVSVAAALGHSTAHTWLKVPAGPDAASVLAATTLPALILGGAPGPDPEATYASWSEAMDIPNVRGLVVGRSLLYPADDDVAAAVDRAARIVRPEEPS